MAWNAIRVRSMAAVSAHPRIGELMREWRERRGRTQLDLALDAGISARHLSFVETGRSHPGPEIILRVAEHLQIPFRERNQLLLAAGYAPVFPQRELDDPELSPVREALDLILTGHEPYPALVVDRSWNLVAANAPMQALASLIDPALLTPPINVMRAGLHPRGLGGSIVNLGEVRDYFLGRLERQVAITRDRALAELLEEVAAYPAPEYHRDPASEAAAGHILTPLMRLRGPDGGELSFFGTVATFGTAAEVTASELSIELGFPADRATAEALRNLSRR
jgi:transcriptional regulator with XRE-family HTH domain